MNNPSSLFSKILSFAAIAALPLAACTSTVSNGGGTSGGGDGAGGGSATVTSTAITTTSSGCPEEGCVTSGNPAGGGGWGAGGSNPTGAGGASLAADAISMLYSELPGVDPGGGGTVASTGSGPPPISPNALVVFIGGQPIACHDPYALDCGGEWFISFIIPPSMQAPGTYALDDMGLNGFANETGEGGGPECSFGGGSFWGGTVTITSVLATGVTGTLQGTDAFWSFDADGAFDAPRCP